MVGGREAFLCLTGRAERGGGGGGMGKAASAGGRVVGGQEGDGGVHFPTAPDNQ